MSLGCYVTFIIMWQFQIENDQSVRIYNWRERDPKVVILTVGEKGLYLGFTTLPKDYYKVYITFVEKAMLAASGLWNQIAVSSQYPIPLPSPLCCSDLQAKSMPAACRVTAEITRSGVHARGVPFSREGVLGQPFGRKKEQWGRKLAFAGPVVVKNHSRNF